MHFHTAFGAFFEVGSCSFQCHVQKLGKIGYGYYILLRILVFVLLVLDGNEGRHESANSSLYESSSYDDVEDNDDDNNDNDNDRSEFGESTDSDDE